jgi:hypothetical protein
VETRDLPPELLLFATKQLMNALLKEDGCSDSANEQQSPAMQRSPPVALDSFYHNREEKWKSIRASRDKLSQISKQQEAEREAELCTFAPVICERSATSRVWRALKQTLKEQKEEGKKLRQQIQERSGHPFKESDFQLAQPLPGRRKTLTGVKSHLARYLEEIEEHGGYNQQRHSTHRQPQHSAQQQQQQQQQNRHHELESSQQPQPIVQRKQIQSQELPIAQAVTKQGQMPLMPPEEQQHQHKLQQQPLQREHEQQQQQQLPHRDLQQQQQHQHLSNHSHTKTSGQRWAFLRETFIHQRLLSATQSSSKILAAAKLLGNARHRFRTNQQKFSASNELKTHGDAVQSPLSSIKHSSSASSTNAGALTARVFKYECEFLNRNICGFLVILVESCRALRKRCSSLSAAVSSISSFIAAKRASKTHQNLPLPSPAASNLDSFPAAPSVLDSPVTAPTSAFSAAKQVSAPNVPLQKIGVKQQQQQQEEEEQQQRQQQQLLLPPPPLSSGLEHPSVATAQEEDEKDDEPPPLPPTMVLLPPDSSTPSHTSGNNAHTQVPSPSVLHEKFGVKQPQQQQQQQQQKQTQPNQPPPQQHRQAPSFEQLLQQPQPHRYSEQGQQQTLLQLQLQQKRQQMQQKQQQQQQQQQQQPPPQQHRQALPFADEQLLQQPHVHRHPEQGQQQTPLQLQLQQKQQH